MPRALFCLLLALAVPSRGELSAGDFALAIPPTAKTALVAGGLAYALTDRNYEGNLPGFSALAVVVGIPNAMLLQGLVAGNSQRVRFWRKFVFYEEALAAGILLTHLAVIRLNQDEDKYPEGPPGQDKDDRPGNLGETFLLAMGVVTIGLGTSALIELIPFPMEKGIGVRVSRRF